MNELVLCDVAWSCDMRVVWLDSRDAMELTPHIWTRIVFDSRLRLKFKMQQLGRSLKLHSNLKTT